VTKAFGAFGIHKAGQAVEGAGEEDEEEDEEEEEGNWKRRVQRGGERVCVCVCVCV
jgi:hypothetical protein